jgi:hypothetical protein
MMTLLVKTKVLRDCPQWKRLKEVVAEVIENGDFPTIPGCEDEHGDCEIFDLFEKLEEEF